MISAATYLSFIAASVVIVIVPGPTVTVIIANSLRGGAKAGLLNVAGTQAGLAVMIAVLAFGLSSIVANLGTVFDIVRVVGAAYLVWLGIKLWRADGSTLDAAPEGGNGDDMRNRDAVGYFWQGFFVIWSNPKALLFFGAFIPQFLDPHADPLAQTILLGMTFMAVATILDGAYAVLAAKAGSMLSRNKVRFAERASGTFLIGGGLWLALGRGFDSVKQGSVP